MDFVQSAYIRPDLWARYNVDQAHNVAQNAELQSTLRGITRLHYGVAALKSATQSTILLAPTIIFLIGHLVTCTVDKVYANRVSAWFRTKNQAYAGCFIGATITTLVALFSATLSTEIGSKIRRFSANRVNESWNDFQKRVQVEFIQNIEKTRQKRINESVHNERFKTGSVIYRTCSGGIQRPTELFFDVLTEKKLGRVRAHIQHVQERMARLPDADQQQVTEEAKRKITDYVNKQTNKLGKLPMTYLDMGDYEIRRAQKYKRKATAFLQREAQRTATTYQSEYPGLFNAQNFPNKVQSFHQSMMRDLDKQIATIQQRSIHLKQEWNTRMGAVQQQQQQLEKAINNQKWWLKYFGWTKSKQEQERVQQEIAMKNMQLAQVHNARRNVAAQIKDGTFHRLLNARQGFDRKFCEYVDANGWITKNGKLLNSVDKFARPWFYERLFHGLGAYVPSFNGWFDAAANN